MSILSASNHVLTGGGAVIELILHNHLRSPLVHREKGGGGIIVHNIMHIDDYS